MPIRLKDVAERAGVSVRTVSNVVNHFHYVAPDTRARVQAAIDELGYRPNAAARHLRGGRTGLIALVVPELDSPYFAELAAHFVDEAERQGWTLLVDQTRGDPGRERLLLETDRAQHVDGVVFSPWGVDPRTLQSAGRSVPVVLLGEQAPGKGWDYVSVDSVAAAREATGHLIEGGRRRIAAIGDQPQLANGTARQRLQGFRAALEQAAVEPAVIAEVTDLHRCSGVQAMRRCLESDGALDAVFCFTDELALGAIRALHELGRRVPDDVAVVGLDDITDGRFSVPTLTTISPDKARLAAVALQRLAVRIADPHAPSVAVTIDHRLIVRESS